MSSNNENDCYDFEYDCIAEMKMKRKLKKRRKMKIYELAEEFGMGSIALLQTLKKMGISFKSYMSTASNADELRERLKEYFAQKRLQDKNSIQKGNKQNE